jgi:hypothetical protein
MSVRASTELEKFGDICKGLQGSVKRIEAIQVFYPRPRQIEDSFTENYRMSRIVDSLSLYSNLYSGQIWSFQVSTAYKTKANKVWPVDPGKTEGSKPRGQLDWLEQSQLDDVLCQDSEQYSDWIILKFSDISKRSWLTKEHIEDLIVEDLWTKEQKLFIEVFYNQEKALAFDFLYIGKVKPDIAPSQVIKTVKHKA